MSAFEYYKKAGYRMVAPQFRAISNAALSTITIWTPLSGLRIGVTNLAISANTGGTMRFYFTGDNGNQLLAEFTVAGSSTIYPSVEGWESTAKNAPLVVLASHGATNGWAVTANGFELE